MVAYSFKPRFADPILSKLKRHTLRNDRKRHARPGERIQLYVSQRHPSGFRLGEATCTGVLRLRISFDQRRVELRAGTRSLPRTTRMPSPSRTASTTGVTWKPSGQGSTQAFASGRA